MKVFIHKNTYEWFDSYFTSFQNSSKQLFEKSNSDDKRLLKVTKAKHVPGHFWGFWKILDEVMGNLNWNSWDKTNRLLFKLERKRRLEKKRMEKSGRCVFSKKGKSIHSETPINNQFLLFYLNPKQKKQFKKQFIYNTYINNNTILSTLYREEIHIYNLRYL